MKLVAAFWRWLWSDLRGPGKIGKAQLEVAITRMNSERRHLERPSPVQRRRNWKRHPRKPHRKHSSPPAAA